ncbi:hypothetical protein GCM10011363_28930 [Marivita lacus]|uniref:Transposase DDE domain-containing protein n=1 Tax=Marivita lacus TaxID=1323742 RepID=A0ABQ1KXB3_9RHOB|nr:hypothetical protein GCM10011363_28930 [Marivita lacus]
MWFFRADAAHAIPALYERLEEADYFYVILLPANNVLREKIAHLLTRPAGRLLQTKVKRFFEDFQYQAASWDKPRGTAAQHIKEGKYAFHWTRLSCRRFRGNEVGRQLHALAYRLASFLRYIELSEEMAH